MSDTITVERSTTINAPAADVYRRIIDMREWANWSVWDELDPTMQKTYTGADSGVGSHYAWVGNRKVGEGSMAIVDAKENESINIDLEFIKPFKSSSKTMFTLSEGDGSTHVNWAMTLEPTLMSRIIGIFRSMDSLVGPDFEKGLANLKRVTEAG